MGLKPDHWIRKMAHEHRMIKPFEDKQVRQGVISYGVSSYGYDVRVADEFKIFTNVFSATVDPKNFDTKSMVDYIGDVCTVRRGVVRAEAAAAPPEAQRAHEKQPARFADVLAPRCQPPEVRVLPGFSEEALACYR